MGTIKSRVNRARNRLVKLMDASGPMEALDHRPAVEDGGEHGDAEVLWNRSRGVLPEAQCGVGEV